MRSRSETVYHRLFHKKFPSRNRKLSVSSGSARETPRSGTSRRDGKVDRTVNGGRGEDLAAVQGAAYLVSDRTPSFG